MTPTDRTLLEELVAADVVEPLDLEDMPPEGTFDDLYKRDGEVGSLLPEERDAFADMLLKGFALTEKQRAWARRVADRIGVSYAVDNSKVPRGAEVLPAPVLQHLPKKPPSRRTA